MNLHAEQGRLLCGLRWTQIPETFQKFGKLQQANHLTQKIPVNCTWISGLSLRLWHDVRKKWLTFGGDRKKGSGFCSQISDSLSLSYKTSPICRVSNFPLALSNTRLNNSWSCFSSHRSHHDIHWDSAAGFRIQGQLEEVCISTECCFLVLIVNHQYRNGETVWTVTRPGVGEVCQIAIKTKIKLEI